MINERTFLGYSLPFENICEIYPPKVKDVIGNKKFSIYKMLLTISQEEIEDELYGVNGATEEEVVPTPLDYLFLQASQSPQGMEIIKEAFDMFVQSEITILFEQKSIVIGNLEKIISELNDLSELENLPMISEDNYFDFQNAIRKSLGEKELEPYNNKQHPKIRRAKALARYRDRVKAKNKDGTTLEELMAAICCMGIGINPLNIGEISYAALAELVLTYQNKEKYETDIRSLQAGADAKKIKPKYWIGKKN